MSTKKIWIYHHTDDDGYGGGAAIYDYIMYHSTLCDINKGYEYNNALINSYAVDYTRPLPDIELIESGDVVFYIDYSFRSPDTKDQFKKLHLHGVNQYWLDCHHSSKVFIDEILELNKTEWEDNPFPEDHIYFDERISGAMIASIYPTHTIDMNDAQLNCASLKVPKIIQFISDWHLFKFHLSETKPFHYGFSMVEDRLNIRSVLWHDAFNHVYIGEKTLIKNGLLLIEYEKMQNNLNLSNAFIAEINGREIVVMNRPGKSTIFGDAYDLFGLVMSYSFNGIKWKYSIFSKEMNPKSENYFDCESFAKQFGGSGHKTVAGFAVDSPIDLKIIGRLYNHPKWVEYKESLKEE